MFRRRSFGRFALTFVLVRHRGVLITGSEFTVPYARSNQFLWGDNCGLINIIRLVDTRIESSSTQMGLNCSHFYSLGLSLSFQELSTSSHFTSM